MAHARLVLKPLRTRTGGGGPRFGILDLHRFYAEGKYRLSGLKPKKYLASVASVPNNSPLCS